MYQFSKFQLVQLNYDFFMYSDIIHHLEFMQTCCTNFTYLACCTNGAPTVAVDLCSHLFSLISIMTNEPMRNHRWLELRLTIGHDTEKIYQAAPQFWRRQCASQPSPVEELTRVAITMLNNLFLVDVLALTIN